MGSAGILHRPNTAKHHQAGTSYPDVDKKPRKEIEEENLIKIQGYPKLNP